MTIRELVGRVLAWSRRADLDRQLSQDIEAHLELAAREFIARGMSPDNAIAAARRQMGNTTLLREDSRDAWGFPTLEAIMQDVRYALRGLCRTPGFTTTVVLTLALGIGANAAIFGVIDRLMFRPYPYLSAPGTVNRVYLETESRGQPSVNTVFPWRRYIDLQRATGMDAFAAQSEWRLAVGTGDQTTIRNVIGVSASFFQFFDASPVRGRWFTPGEEMDPLSAQVAILSHATWTNDFGQAEVIGNMLKVGVTDYTIIGVAPPDFVAAAAGAPPDIFVPITSVPANIDAWFTKSSQEDYNWEWVQVFVRRKPGVTPEVASAALGEAYRWSRESERMTNPYLAPDSVARPRAIAGPTKQAAGPSPARDSQILLWVMGVAGMVLAIACANVANLMLARVVGRRREVSLRLALGVRRSRLVAQFVVEGMVLALLGCVAGLLVAQWGGAAIRSLLRTDSSSFSLMNDWRTLGVAAACATLAALLTTLGPAFVATRTDILGSLKAGIREGGGKRSPARSGLVVLQAALSVLLLIGAGLFVRSFVNARAVSLGYDPGPVLDVYPDFRGVQMDSVKAVAERARLLDVARSLPGVTTAAMVDNPLFASRLFELRVEGIDSVAALGRFAARIASPEYFGVLQIPILRGRIFDERDREGAPLVAVVSESMAQVLWPGLEAIGQCMRVGGGGLPPAQRAPCTVVIGVAENTAQRNITDDPRFMYYMPAAQRSPQNVLRLYLRMASAETAGEVERVRRELSRAMPGDGFVVVRPLQELVDQQSRSWRLGAMLFTAFGALAFVVAIVGLYGVVAYTVVQRARELAVRVALGARTSDVVRLILRQGLGLTAVGVTSGLVIGWLTSPWVEPLLFDLSARDPLTYTVVAASMLLAATAASLIPAMRARRTDPNTALRSE